MDISRVVRAVARRTTGLISYVKDSLRYSLGTAKASNVSQLIVNILIVKNDNYVKVAKICIDSFLYFHPNAIIKIHCDEKIYPKAKTALKNKSVEIISDCASDEPWQLLKLKLFLKLSGTTEILMDADLKWNGPLPKLETITYFVREFTFKDNELYVELFNGAGWQKYLQYSMKNTSLVTLNGYKFTNDAVSNLISKIELLETTIKKSNFSVEQKKDLSRIAEQVVLSLVFDDNHCTYLKESDFQFDGSLVESSYFGATGTRFGMFGATSK